jgi:hypothetical protein
MTWRLVGGLAVVGTVVGACVIAEPPADLPTLPAEPPVIVRSGVVPPPNTVLTSWPDKFFVPVKLSDSRESVLAAYFADWNTATGSGFENYQQSDPPATGAAANPRVLEVQITPQSTDSCHVIEVVVQLYSPLVNVNNPTELHNPSAGGDSIVWFYNPNGDLAGCPTFDAGLQPDAQALESNPEAGIP